MRCGTIEPEAIMQNGVNRTEGVTNSYAVKYMGANRALIQQSIDYAASTGHKQYRMDAFTDRAAELHRLRAMQRGMSNRAGFWNVLNCVSRGCFRLVRTSICVSRGWYPSRAGPETA